MSKRKIEYVNDGEQPSGSGHKESSSLCIEEDISQSETNDEEESGTSYVPITKKKRNESNFWDEIGYASKDAPEQEIKIFKINELKIGN